MYDSDLPPNVTPVDDEVIDAVDSDEVAPDESPDDVESVDPTDAELDGIAADLDTVEAAMKALDRDDMDEAESLAGSLAADPPPEPGSTEV